MINLNPALSFNFAAAEAARAASATRGVEDSVATQLRQAVQEQVRFPVGSIITAHYKYKVAADGSLQPVQTQITTEAPNEQVLGRRSRRQSTRQEGDREPNLADFMQPKAELSPSDEARLFASLGTTQATNEAVPLTAKSRPKLEVSDENGDAVEAEILTAGSPENSPSATRFSAQVQFSVATLYARNNDRVYYVTPIANFAA